MRMTLIIDEPHKFIGGSARVKDVRRFGLLKATAMTEEDQKKADQDPEWKPE